MDANPNDNGDGFGQAPGLYVHVPFCASKCPYCAFASCTRIESAPAFRDAVLAEAARYRNRFSPFDTLYFGGGTPGFVDPAILGDIVHKLRNTLAFKPDCEATIEVNPADVTADRAAAWHDMGFCRASLGAQAFDDDALRFLGRRHDASGVSEALLRLRHAGFVDIGIDLIYGLPGQTREAWRSTLRRALDAGPTHLSCYALSIEPRTPLAKAVRKREVELPGESAVAALFLDTSRFLAKAGFIHYEVSNYALLDRYRSRHNVKYWRSVPTLGLGPSAHSFDGTRRWWNVRSLEAYLRRSQARISPVAASERLTNEMRRLETLAMGFRTREGVSLDVLRDGPAAEAALSRLVADGRLKIHLNRAVPTTTGFLVADSLARTFA